MSLLQSSVKGEAYMMPPLLAENKKLYILNVSSAAGFQAIPTLSIYAASKAFVLSISRLFAMNSDK